MWQYKQTYFTKILFLYCVCLCAVNKALTSFDLLSCRSCGELWWSFKEWNKLILHSSVSSVIRYRCHGLTKGISLFGDTLKMQCIIGWDLNRSGDLLEQPAQTHPSRCVCVCGMLLHLRCQVLSGIIQHLVKFWYLYNCCSHMSRNVPLNNQYVLFWDLRGRDAICSVNEMEVLHYVVNVQVTTCPVFWNCWLDIKQQALIVTGHRPTRMNILISIDTFFQMLNFFLRNILQRKMWKIFYRNIIFKVNNKITTYASSCLCIYY